LTGPLQVEIIRSTQVSSRVQESIDRLDRLAFVEDSEFDLSAWADSDWMVLGRLDGEIVSQLGLLKREIRINAVPLFVGGVGGVATHPGWRRSGFSSALLSAVAEYMQIELKVPFGLLVCASESSRFYARMGWRTVATELWCTVKGELHCMKTIVMILPLSQAEWPEGKIDLCGPPW
jgi:aminoglycoside 2'-N-acetyltransferase I